MLSGATIKDRVVHDLVGSKFPVALHVLEHAEGTVDITLDAIPLYNRRVCDDVWLNARTLHVLQQRGSTVHCTALGTGVKHCVVSNGVARNAFLFHLLVGREDLFDAAGNCKTLQHRRVDHCVDAPTVLRVRLVLNQVPSLISLPVGHKRLCHAAKGDGGGFHILFAHLLPQFTNSCDVTSLPVSLDHRAVGRRRQVHWLAAMSSFHEV
mmetsp:Transcript_63822/g.168945  ORF Transcript_63822/g.168945 Transcript_63822/m.168945 type:complete len:209 (+) Transcript_63822:651-1277(+)